MEPEEMQAAYLRSKEKLFRLNPDVVEESRRKPKKKRSQKSMVAQSDSRPGVAKLMQKLQTIESDVLFDKDEAEAKWVERRNFLAKEDSQRRRAEVSRPQTPKSAQELTAQTSENQAVDRESKKDEGLGLDDDNALADLFEALPDSSTGTTTKEIPDDETGNAEIDLRNFWTDKPVDGRRVLQDACKSRYVDFM